MGLRGNVCRVRGLPGVKQALDRLDRRVRRRAVCNLSPRLHVQRSATPSTRMQCVAAQNENTSPCRYIDQLGVGPILPLLHEIDAVAELQRLDVSVLVHRHAPTDGSRALTRPLLTCVCLCVCVCVCACVTSHGSALLPSAPPTPSVSGDPSRACSSCPHRSCAALGVVPEHAYWVMEAKESQAAAAGRSTHISTQPRPTHPPFLPPMRGGMVLAGHYSAHHTGTSSHGPIMVLDSKFCRTNLT